VSALAPLLRQRRRFRVQVAARALGVTATAGAAVVMFVWGGVAWTLPVGTALALTAWQLAALVRYAERPVRDLLRFFEALRYDDLTVRSAADDRGPLFEAVAHGFDEVSQAFRLLRSEREEQAQVLQAVVRHIGVALVAFRVDGEVVLFNPAAKRLLGVPALRRVEHLARWSPALTDALGRLRPGERALVRVDRGERALDLAVHAAQVRLQGDPLTLVTLQDIRPELEEREMEAWQQLTRVLTHEIANSVAPIASLAATARERLAEAVRQADGDGGAVVQEALATIERRSRGLIRFVDAYKSLTRVPQPQVEVVPVAELLGGVRALLATALRGHGIELEVSVEPPDLEVAADPELIEQVLINLLLNAVEALAGREGARVRIAGRVGESGRPVIEVSDNGPGIEPEALERIFVPFFTTKPTGSGIGLSLSRQILRLHGGTLSARSAPGEETVFSLRF
jgi:two-component system, NtrC family, nitrogen regulation sensor histidine kinase NtrY